MFGRRFAGLFLLFCFIRISNSFAEGIKQLMPDSNVSAAGLYLFSGLGSAYTRFAMAGCPQNYRLNIYIKSPGESILIGIKAPESGITYNLRKPNGTIVLTGTCPYLPSQTGYVTYYHQAVTGPFPQYGGYTPLVYKTSSISDTGNYYFEFSFPSNWGNETFNLWDFQVVTGAHDPAVPSDTLNGRVWASAWQLYADLGNIVYQPFNGKFFVYSDDGIVTRLAFSNAHVGAVTIFCNPWGCLNTGNFNTDRQSRNQPTYSTFPGIARYKVFLNNPDSTVYPSGAVGQIVGSPFMTDDPAYPPCSLPKLIVAEVDKPGTIEVTISFPYGGPGTTVDYYSQVNAGMNDIPWNGLDGQGNPVPEGTVITVTLNYVNGLTNLPIWDQERNPEGYMISLVRPVVSVMVPETYWDDSQLLPTYICPVAPQSVNLTGCLPGSIPGYTGCHPWGAAAEDCHDKTINTWWYSGSSSAIFNYIFTIHPPDAVGHDSARCGPGRVKLSATVQPYETVDWYATPLGGTPLLTGSTSFLTPFLFQTQTFYAQARDTGSQCLSLGRAPATAIIKPVISPAISGPDSVCVGSEGNIYFTQPGMSIYKWEISAGGVITAGPGTDSVTVHWIAGGFQTISVLFGDSLLCVDDKPAVMNVNVFTPAGDAGPVRGPSPLCAGASGEVYSVDPVMGAAVYVWTVPPGVSVIAGSGTREITVNIDSSAVSGEITVYAINPCGPGLVSPPFYLKINHTAVAFAGKGDTLCQGTVFRVNGAYTANDSSLLWTSDGLGTISDPSALLPVYSPAPGDTGFVHMTLVAYAFKPCLNDTSLLSLKYIPPVHVYAGSDMTVCGLTSCYLGTSSALNYSGLQWRTDGTGSFSDPLVLHPVYFPGTEDVLKGYVRLILEAAAPGPCGVVVDSLTVFFLKGPVARAGPGGGICNLDLFRVAGSSAENFSSILWTHNGPGTLSGQATLEPTYTPAAGESGIVTINLLARGSAACTDSVASDSLQLIIYSVPESDAGPGQIIPDSSSTVLQGSASGGSGSWSWTWEPASLLWNPFVQNPETKILFADTSFYLTVKDLETICTARDSTRVKVKKTPPHPVHDDCILVHNVITPNGDALNDILFIDCIEKYPDNSVQIFNRWGNRIRSFDRYDNSRVVWNGTNEKGELMPDGTYYYVLTIKELGTRSGWIFIRDGKQ